MQNTFEKKFVVILIKYTS